MDTPRLSAWRHNVTARGCADGGREKPDRGGPHACLSPDLTAALARPGSPVLLAPVLAGAPATARRGRHRPGARPDAHRDPGRGDQPGRTDSPSPDPAGRGRHARAAPDDAGRRLDPERADRLRADGHAAEPHEHGHRPPDRPGRRRPRRHLERRPPGPGDGAEAAGGPVESVFSTVHATGRETALFATKTKFSLWRRSWPDGAGPLRDPATTPTAVLTRSVRRDIIDDDRAFTFVHLGHTDVVGHARGWMSPAYLDAVRAADGYVGRILDAIASAGETGETLVVVTADHGGAVAPTRTPRRTTTTGSPSSSSAPMCRPGPTSTTSTPPTATPAPAARRTCRGSSRSATAPSPTWPPTCSGSRPCRGSQVDALQDLDVFAGPCLGHSRAARTPVGRRWSPWTRSTTHWESRRRRRRRGGSR